MAFAKLLRSRKPRRPASASVQTLASVGRGRPERSKNATASAPVSLPSLSAEGDCFFLSKVGRERVREV
jgi:hypothetical protein